MPKKPLAAPLMHEVDDPLDFETRVRLMNWSIMFELNRGRTRWSKGELLYPRPISRTPPLRIPENEENRDEDR
jgi:hypothetical protein